jgi:hypothetical protein
MTAAIWATWALILIVAFLHEVGCTAAIVRWAKGER